MVTRLVGNSTFRKECVSRHSHSAVISMGSGGALELEFSAVLFVVGAGAGAAGAGGTAVREMVVRIQLLSLMDVSVTRATRWGPVSAIEVLPGASSLRERRW